MKTLSWIVSAALGLLSLSFIIANYAIVAYDITRKPDQKRSSTIPIAGGLIGFFALRATHLAAFPEQGWAAYAWVPPLVDPGCYIVMIVLAPIAAVLKRVVNRA